MDGFPTSNLPNHDRTFIVNITANFKSGYIPGKTRSLPILPMVNGEFLKFLGEAIAHAGDDLIMTQTLANKRVAILATDGVEQVELLQPQQALEQAGAQAQVVSLKSGSIQGFNHHDRGDEIPVDMTLDQANPNDYDALVLPGGALNPDQLRMEPKAVQFVRSFFEAGKPVAAICHAPWTLIEADVVKGRTLTSWSSLQTDLRNAGATWVDQAVVVDRGLVTSRNPHDIPAFNQKMIEVFAEGQHEEQRRSA